jgi:hypothetical protein
MFRPAWPLAAIYSNNAQDGCQDAKDDVIIATVLFLTSEKLQKLEIYVNI